MAVPELSRQLAIASFLLTSTVAMPLLAWPDAGPASASVQIAETGSRDPTLQLDATDAYRLALLKMKGQLNVARALLQIRAPGADHHLGPPLRALFRDAEAELDRRSAPFTVEILGELESAARSDAVRALTTVDLAVNALNGSFAQTGAMDAESVLALVEALLRAAVANYADAVTANEVVDLEKYQSGRGFVTEAEALVRHSSGLKGRPGHTALLDVVILIRQAWPGIIPPPIVFDPLDVAGRLNEAVAAMEQLR